MLYQIAIAVGGMIVLVLLFVIFHQLADRMRALNGECRMDSLRCLGCLATGRCGDKDKNPQGRGKPDRPGLRAP